MIFLSFGMPIEVIYVKESLGAGNAAYGVLLAAWGAGTVLASIGLPRVRRNALALIPLSAGAMGAGYLIMAVSPAVGVAAAGCLIGGIGNGVYYVSVIQSVQERIEESFQARVMGLLESVNATCYGLGFLAGGAVAAAFDARLAFGVAAGGVFVATGVIRTLLRHHGDAPARVPAAGAAPVPEPVAG
jgi:MFS family permease